MKNSHKFLLKNLHWLGLVILLSLAPPAFAQIVGSKHDLGTGGGGQAPGGTDEVCVFCHTPHAADTTEPNLPLWNRVSNIEQTRFTRYSSTGTPSFDSEEADVGSISLACLSCHDGTQAMDAVINAPGSGNYNAGGASIGGGLSMTPALGPLPNLTEDLSDDHPISIPYAAGGPVDGDADGTYPGVLVDPDFKDPEKATLNLQPIWWVDVAGGVAGTREKNDIMLYARNETVNLVTDVRPFVECGSCHDPHNADSASVVVGSEAVAFLRADDNADSKICVACHDK